jgi:hypothetical protein
VSNLHKLHTAAALLASFCYMFVMFNIRHWQMDAMSGMSGGMAGGGGMSGGGGMGPMPGPAPMPGMLTPAPMPSMTTPAPMPGMPKQGPMPGTYTSLDQNDPLFMFIWLSVLGLCANLGVAAIATTLAVVLPEQALYGSAADMQHALLLLLRRQVLVLTRLFLFAIACVWVACAVLPWAHNVYGGEEAKGGDTGKAAALSVLCATLLAACLGVSWHEWQNYGATSGVMHEGGGEGPMEGMDELLQRVVEK